MNNPTSYATVFDALYALQDRGYAVDFTLLDNLLFCAQHKMFVRPGDFMVREVHYFKDDRQRETVLYAIECESYEMKGILLSHRKNSMKNLIMTDRSFIFVS